MKIADIGGEFAFIRRVAREYRDPAIVRGAGDDCAAIDHPPGRLLLLTTDMMVENTHFTRDWFTPRQIGRKLMEVNVSDIVSMGGVPRHAVISLAMPPDTTIEFMDELYRGLYESAEAHGVALVGGDTTRGRELTLNLALTGEVEPELVRYRSGALPGDRICVTGTLGKNEAGLRLLMAGKPGYTQGFLEPRARRADEGRVIARYAHAMIDVSDGLASEVRHICEHSGAGAIIECDAIPISAETRDAAAAVGFDPSAYALYGGEDFELVFTAERSAIDTLRSVFQDFTVVGEILSPDGGIRLRKGERLVELDQGFDHFAKT
ncbi:MAG TPA: thiamine-phosphate kinase [Spirochaetota bacterium]|nr:thiamine-phosphate kinase [Spirochaetota bacterium]HNT11486.1 thiamine-phosphate kinase [Spirochaetota bacterium]